MNYPVWELYSTGGGLLIALIAILHVYISHFAVGGGLYLVLCEYKANRNQEDELLVYLKKHARFFMLLTMVLGGVTGVGIWFTMTLLSPEASSILIHQFVFAWAVEWVFFTGEIIALFIYYYTFNRIDSKVHMRIGWIYFAFAWLSLFVINAIISFMLTPGQWLETGNFWHAFFNPGFVPSLFFRTALTLVIAGIFGLLTAVTINNESLRNTQIRYCGKWMLTGLLALPIFAHFYFHALPQRVTTMIQGASPETQPLVVMFLILSVMLLIGATMLLIQLSWKTQKVLAYCLLIMGLIYMGSFEWIRESARKPFIIYDYLYANQTFKKDTPQFQQQGMMANARWTPHQTISNEKRLQAGHDLFFIACSSCHSVGGPMNDILPLTENYTPFGIEALLTGQGKLSAYMPVFQGTDQERKALSHYIVNGLHKKETQQSVPPSLTLTTAATDHLIFDQYTLLAWANKGMHLHGNCKEKFILGKPSGKIEAQLLRRGELPEHAMEAIEMRYECKSRKVSGKMIYDDFSMTYIANDVRINEFDDNNQYNPYPIVTIEAIHAETGKCLARTQMVFAVSSAMGCKNCHGGQWKNGKESGIADDTAFNILKTHDHISQTTLVKDMKQGRIKACNDCHQPEGSGDKSVLNLSAAMHGFHAIYIDNATADACMNCHASYNGNSLCLRGIHKQNDLSCTNCHGNLTDHALSLLVHEKNNGKKAASRYMAHLSPININAITDINPRAPWIQEPDCLNCHIDFNLPETTSAFNQWTPSEKDLFRNRTGDAGIRCVACHGAPHVIYPSENMFDSERDNSQTNQYQNEPGPIGGNKQCQVCHQMNMEENYHHVNMMQ